MRNHQTSSADTADVIVVGGGVIGLAVARALRLRSFSRVTVIERSVPGAEASSAAAGMLAVQAEADAVDAFMSLAGASLDLYPALALDLLEETGIDIELDTTGTIHLAFTDEDKQPLDHRYQWQRAAGLPVERLSREEILRLEPMVSPSVRFGIKFPRDIQVENRRLIRALVRSLENLNVRIMAGAEALSLLTERERIIGVDTSRGQIGAPIVVVANGAWASFLTIADSGVQPVSIEPVRGQMLCFELGRGSVRHVLNSSRGYLVPRFDGRLLAGSTTEHEGFDKSVSDKGVAGIRANAGEIVPAINGLRLQDSWAGLRPRPDDDLPIIGAYEGIEGLYIATGHYRNGILLAPITAELLSDEIATGVTPALLRDFGPHRFHAVGVGH